MEMFRKNKLFCSFFYYHNTCTFKTGFEISTVTRATITCIGRKGRQEKCNQGIVNEKEVSGTADGSLAFICRL